MVLVVVEVSPYYPVHTVVVNVELERLYIIINIKLETVHRGRNLAVEVPDLPLANSRMLQPKAITGGAEGGTP